MHLFAICLGNALGNNALVKAANQLLDSFTFATFYPHGTARSAVRYVVMVCNHQVAWGEACLHSRIRDPLLSPPSSWIWCAPLTVAEPSFFCTRAIVYRKASRRATLFALPYRLRNTAPPKAGKTTPSWPVSAVWVASATSQRPAGSGIAPARGPLLSATSHVSPLAVQV